MPRTALAIGTRRFPALSNAICPIARWLKMPLPGTSVQLRPPSVDLKMPTPASESPDALGSPVPAYRVLPLASAGSIRIEPIAFDGTEPPVKVQVELAPESALSVTQMP